MIILSLLIDKLLVTQFLLEHGADPNIKDINGKTPLEYAEIMGILMNKYKFKYKILYICTTANASILSSDRPEIANLLRNAVHSTTQQP